LGGKEITRIQIWMYFTDKVTLCQEKFMTALKNKDFFTNRLSYAVQVTTKENLGTRRRLRNPVSVGNSKS
jgi:hypothetical protein